MENLLAIILTTILIATLLNIFFKRFEIPTVIGYILSGVIISQIFSLEHNTQQNSSLQQIGEFGIVFLMFTIGLEFSIKHLKQMKKEVFLYGGLQMIVTGNLFGAFAHNILGIELKSAIIIGFSLALSSTAIVLKMLTEKNEIHSGYGRVVLGILLLQDIAVIPILLMISIFTTTQHSVANMLLWTTVDALLLLLIIFVLGRYILEHFLTLSLLSNSEEIFLLTNLTIVVGISYLAHSFGFSYSLGAFLAGMTLAETRFKYRLESDIMSFRDLFLGVFFVTIGMQIEPQILLQHWLLIPILLIAVLVSKAMVIFILLGRFLQKRTALKSALALMQVGEFALAIFALASQNNLIDPETNQLLIITVVLSMIITPFVIKELKILADLLFRQEAKSDIPIISKGYHNHILILGYGPLGQKIANRLKERSIPYLIIEHDYRLVKEAKERGEPIILANASSDSILKEISAPKALAITVAIENPQKTRLVVDTLKRVAPDVKTIVAVKNRSQEDIIKSFGIKYVVNASELLTKEILKELLECRK